MRPCTASTGTVIVSIRREPGPAGKVIHNLSTAIVDVWTLRTGAGGGGGGRVEAVWKEVGSGVCGSWGGVGITEVVAQLEKPTGDNWSLCPLRHLDRSRVAA